MATDNPAWASSIIGGVFILLLNFVLGERKSSPRDEEEPDDPGKIAKNAVGAAFVDKSTADTITRIAANVEIIKNVVVENAERGEEESRRRELENSLEHKINRALDRLEHRETERNRRHKDED